MMTMINSDFKIWNPTNYEHGSYLDKVEFMETQSGLILKVENESKIFTFIYDQLDFGNYVECFRFIDDMKGSYLQKEASKARREYFDVSKSKWYLYKSTRSDFLNWFDNQPGPGTDMYPIEHHVISTSETTFEILSKYEPKVVVENK